MIIRVNGIDYVVTTEQEVWHLLRSLAKMALVFVLAMSAVACESPTQPTSYGIVSSPRIVDGPMMNYCTDPAFVGPRIDCPEN